MSAPAQPRISPPCPSTPVSTGCQLTAPVMTISHCATRGVEDAVPGSVQQVVAPAEGPRHSATQATQLRTNRHAAAAAAAAEYSLAMELPPGSEPGGSPSGPVAQQLAAARLVEQTRWGWTAMSAERQWRAQIRPTSSERLIASLAAVFDCAAAQHRPALTRHTSERRLRSAFPGPLPPGPLHQVFDGCTARSDRARERRLQV